MSRAWCIARSCYAANLACLHVLGACLRASAYLRPTTVPRVVLHREVLTAQRIAGACDLLRCRQPHATPAVPRRCVIACAALYAAEPWVPNS